MNAKTRSPRTVRCAIYTRKSTEEGLEQEFNSLAAQREAAQAYIASQHHEGWLCLPETYDDGGFTGANTDRPGLQRLLADCAAGRIDCVVVYKVDRLSRSLLDFGRIIETFDQQQVAFVSVTQQFNTATSMGRLVLNVLLSFAQFEREIISERTRDKIAATRRKGKWCGGPPILGYDVHNMRLVVNEEEAARVRATFALYLRLQALSETVAELGRRGWVNKCWRTHKGQEVGGKVFTKSSLHKLLTNVLYAGQIKHKREVHAGEHERLIAPELWQQVQDLLHAQAQTKGAMARNRFGALLKGLLRCVACGRSMTPSHSASNGKRYRYYVCTGAQKLGWRTCPMPSVAAPALEQVVLTQLRDLAQEASLAECLADEHWQTLGPLEQARLVRALVQRIEFDGGAGKLVLALHADGQEQPAEELLEIAHATAHNA